MAVGHAQPALPEHERWAPDGSVAMRKLLALVFSAVVLLLAGCSSNTDEGPAVRKRLLSATPIGSDATNVLNFVVDDLKPKQGVTAYCKYVDAVQAGRARRLDVQPVDPLPPAIPMPSDWPQNENYPSREIYVWIKTYFNGNRLFATWTFDKNDKLLKIYVGRDRSP